MSQALSDNEMASLAKVAQLRGHIGKIRAQMVMARDLLLRNEHVMPPSKLERDALTILSRALEITAP